VFGISAAAAGQSGYTKIHFAAPRSPQRAIKADTGGHGRFESDGSVRIRRGFFETIGEPSVALSDGHDFMIRFRCEIVSSRRDREFDLRIIDSDRGDAVGSAYVRLNGDRNEIEQISLKGRLRGRRMSANFNRD